MKSVGQGIQWAAKPFLQCMADINHSCFRSDLTTDLCWYQWVTMQKAWKIWRQNLSNWRWNFSLINFQHGYRSGKGSILYLSWDSWGCPHSNSPKSLLCVHSEFKLLQLTNSASPSSSNPGLFLRKICKSSHPLSSDCATWLWRLLAGEGLSHQAQRQWSFSSPSLVQP